MPVIAQPHSTRWSTGSGRTSVRGFFEIEQASPPAWCGVVKYVQIFPK